MDFPNPFNLASYFLDHNLPARADRPAVIYRDIQWSYADVYRAACRFAGAAAEAGVRQEDRVLVILPDCPAFVAAVMGIHKLGAVLTMVNPRLPAADLEYYFNYTKAPLAVLAGELVEPVAAMMPQLRYLRAVLVAEDGCSGRPLGKSRPLASIAKSSERATSVHVAQASATAASARQTGEFRVGKARFLPWDETLAAQPPEFANAPTHPNDPAVWLFTSGTSGKPKAAMHVQHDFAFNTEHYAKQVLRLSESDRTLSVPKLFFGYATGTNLWFPFAVGGTTVLFEEHATPEVMFDCIARHRPTFLTTVPTMINKMLSDEPSDECGGADRPPDVARAAAATSADLSCIRLAVSAGEKLPAELYRRWKERFGVEVLDGIGSAEMFHIYISNFMGDVRLGSLGREVPGYEARIVDAEGRDVNHGDIGTLWIRGDSMMTGYHGDPCQSRDRLRGDWLNTCDMFRQDEAGYFYYEGRADDLLKVCGIFVSPGEIENCLLQHPAVKECAVVGYEDSCGLVRARAFVVVRDGRRGDEQLTFELIEFTKSRIARYKAPSAVAYLDALPRNDRGKVERKKLG